MVEAVVFVPLSVAFIVGTTEGGAEVVFDTADATVVVVLGACVAATAGTSLRSRSKV